MKPLLFLTAMALPVAWGYNSSSDCIGCFTSKYSNKFCLKNFGASSGFCCDKSSTTDYCSSSRYYCSDNAPNDAVKLSYCPWIDNKCYGKAVTTIQINEKHDGATTMLFTTNNVCSWRLRSIPEYYFNKQIQINIETAN